MNARHSDANTIADSDADALSAGLRAAFAAESHEWTQTAGGVLATLTETIGPCRSVLLRDTEDDRSPIVRPTPPATETPITLSGRYQVLGEMARGGVGIVYKGRDVDLGRDVAIKVLRSDHARNPAMVQRFVEEAQIAGQLQHPGVLPVYELGLQSDRKPFFTMKLVKGQTLAALLAARSDSADERLRFVRILARVCETVAYAHAKGVIHRDLKPSNVLVGAFGEVQVVDWGLAKVLPQGGLADEERGETFISTARSSAAADASIAGSVMGTPAYMPPEQARGEVARIDERCDVFSLGAILCETLTGKPPYEGSREVVLQRAAAGELSGALQRLEACGADVELVALAQRCLSAAPADRPASAGAVAAAVTGYLESLEARARSSEIAAAQSAEKAAGERRARRLTLALASTVCLALLAGGATYARFQLERQERRMQSTNALSGALDRAALALGRAKAAHPGQTGPWNEAIAAGGHVEQLLVSGEPDEDARRRATDFLAELKRADSDQRLMQRVEEAIIVGATHYDAESWQWMSHELRAAFREYGIDLDTLSDDEVAARIRSSTLAPQLTDGLELWIATEGSLNGFGAGRLSEGQLREKMQMLYDADPDPFRMRLRQLVHGAQPPDCGQLRALAAEAPFDSLLPRTLAWLATGHAMCGDFEAADEIFRKAIRLHPDDFMLNFDYAYCSLAAQKRLEDAIRAYNRAIALRPRTGGVWRALGIALRESGDLRGAIDALQQSIELQAGHAPTHVDLAAALRRAQRYEEAIAAAGTAIRLKPALALAHGELGHALQAAGRLEEALAAFEECHRAGSQTPRWSEPSQKWIDDCRTAIATLRESNH